MAQYIDKDALVAELEKRISDYWSDPENEMSIYPYALKDVIKYIGTLEVKKDTLIEYLDQEMDRLWNLIPDADDENPTQMELRYLGEYIATERLADRVNEMYNN